MKAPGLEIEMLWLGPKDHTEDLGLKSASLDTILLTSLLPSVKVFEKLYTHYVSTFLPPITSPNYSC